MRIAVATVFAEILTVGTYAITDSGNWALDGGFYFYQHNVNVEEWTQTTQNPFQQWQFELSPDGSSFYIYNVGNGNSIGLSDGGGVLQIGVGVDAWTAQPVTNGYTLRNVRTGRYIGPDLRRRRALF